MMKKCFFSFLLAITLTGCATVPQTVFTVDPRTGQVHVTSPKEIDLEGLAANVAPGGGFTLTIKRYRSHNSADVIGAVAVANSDMAKELSKLTDKLLQAGASGAKGGL